MQQFYNHFLDADFALSFSINEAVQSLSEPVLVQLERMPSTLKGL